tara:strand:+ start:9488 stop:9946 length:459 start_codon:yes stop_codon:yes gene_type:complete
VAMSRNINNKPENHRNPSTGYLLIAHGNLSQELLRVLEFISGPQPRFIAIGVEHVLDPEHARDLVKTAVDELMTDEGVLIFTDLFGGSPSNIALSLLDDKNIEIVAGINLPMLIYAAHFDDDLPLKEKAKKLRDYGAKNIFVASEVLSTKQD